MAEDEVMRILLLVRNFLPAHEQIARGEVRGRYAVLLSALRAASGVLMYEMHIITRSRIQLLFQSPRATQVSSLPLHLPPFMRTLTCFCHASLTMQSILQQP